MILHSAAYPGARERARQGSHASGGLPILAKRTVGEAEMGQYFSWVNVDRFERLDAGLWDFAPTLYGRCVAPCEENQAMLSLLATRWRGDVVVFLGDYASFEGDERPGCRHVRERIGTSGWPAPDGRGAGQGVLDCWQQVRGARGSALGLVPG